MTDEEDRRKKGEERRHPSEKDETAMPRRAHDSGRVRKAIRTELEEVAEAGADTQAASGPKPGRKAQNIVISLENISLSFEEQILNDISFNAVEGETIVVVGESGTGKSTILKLLLRLLIPDNGRVAIDGEDITHLTFDDALKVRQKMGMVFQGAALFDSMTVYENVAYPLREHTTLNEDEIEARVREKLQFVDLEPDRVMDQMPSELSGGMKKRVGIARGLANNHALRRADFRPRPAHDGNHHLPDPQAAARAWRHQHRRFPRHSIGLQNGEQDRSPGEQAHRILRHPRGDDRQRGPLHSRIPGRILTLW
jgi:ABC-type ATPase involved in cell division